MFTSVYLITIAELHRGSVSLPLSLSLSLHFYTSTHPHFSIYKKKTKPALAPRLRLPRAEAAAPRALGPSSASSGHGSGWPRRRGCCGASRLERETVQESRKRREGRERGVNERDSQSYQFANCSTFLTATAATLLVTAASDNPYAACTTWSSAFPRR